MAVQPIDLQVLFARLNQVGREQALLRDAQTQAQAVAGSEIAERSEEQDHRVSQADNAEEGSEVDDESQTKQGDGRQRNRRDTPGEATNEVFSDPDLGQNVDLSG
jgi:hypothetical protein